jgi:type I restriction enzyme M protein
MADRDTKGDLYEYLLSKIASAGQNGQFRTPRHIINMMVAMARPQPTDTICDPAAGTAGFLVSAGEYLRENHNNLFFDKELKEHFNKKMFNGIEFDATMIRIAAMNLMLHGIEEPNLRFVDALSEANGNISGEYSLMLANPPFKGSLDYNSVDNSLLQTVKTKKTELLFLALILRMLQTGGRAAVIVPDGVLFGASKAHTDIRRELVDNQRLQAVISMPSGVFKPYAGVSTAILLFTKTNSGGTDKVWFYDMKADGYSLDDKRNKIDENDIPDILERWGKPDDEAGRKRTDKSFFVPAEEIRENNYDLSINRYKEIVYEEVKYDPPKEIIADIRQLENEKQKLLNDLEDLLK